MLDPDWVRNQASHFDLMHVHFRFESVAPESIIDTADELRRLRKPLVFTVHDLENPMESDQKSHLDRLDALVASSDALVTLTSKAADAVKTRYGREIVVIPHPHVLPLPWISALRVTRNYRTTSSSDKALTVGVHLKSLRPGVDALGVLTELDAVCAKPTELRLRVDYNADAVDAPNWGVIRPVLERLVTRESVIIACHPRFDDSEFRSYLASLDVAILPYGLGTHSGWAEACLDAGVTVVAPQTTCIGSQHASVLEFDVTTPATLLPLLESISRAEIGPQWGGMARLHQRAQIALAHRALYRRVLIRL